MSPYDCLTKQDFDRSSLAVHHWLDEPRNMDGRKSKKHDPNVVYKVFARFEDDEDPVMVRQKMISTISTEFNWYSDVAHVCLQMHKLTLSRWMEIMQDQRYPTDELAVYALSRIYNQHRVIYTKTKTWSSLGTTWPISEKELYDICKIKFVNMGKGKLVELISKPSSLMPVVKPAPLLSTYESGYYETDQNVMLPIKDEPPDVKEQDERMNILPVHVPDPEAQSPSSMLIPSLDHDEPEHDHTMRCPVHGCQTTTEDYGTMCKQKSNPEPPETVDEDIVPLVFPSSTEVCDTGANSALKDFNPLSKSEPNLPIGDHEYNQDMTDQNNDEPYLSRIDMINDARSKKWEVPVRKLSSDEIEFLSGPRLLPNLLSVPSDDQTNSLSDLPPPSELDNSSQITQSAESPNKMRSRPSRDAKSSKQLMAVILCMLKLLKGHTHIFSHNFLNIQPIFYPQKVLEISHLGFFNHTIKYSLCQRC